jgi:hypothetical protein
LGSRHLEAAIAVITLLYVIAAIFNKFIPIPESTTGS